MRNLLASSLLVLVTSTPIFAQSWFVDADPTYGEAAFGSTVAVAGPDVLIGEPQGFRNPGTIHVYRPTPLGTWDEAAVIRRPEARIGDRFGAVFSADADLLLASDPELNANAGGVYVYVRDAGTSRWTRTQTLTIQGGQESDRFGSAISVSRNIALVASPGTDGDAGAVHVYVREEQSMRYAGLLPVSGLVAGDGFGSAVAMNGALAVVGAPNAGSNAGATYLFRQNESGEWMEVGRVARDSETEAGLRFGSVVATNGIDGFAGSPVANKFQGMASALSFTESGVVEAALDRPMIDENPWFGAGIAATETELFVTAPQAMAGSGTVIRYTRIDGEWAIAEQIGPADAGSRARTGSSIAATGSVLVLGAAGDAYGEGSAFILDRRNDGWSSPNRFFPDPEPIPRVEGKQVDCTDGDAAGFDCTAVDLVSFVPSVDMGIARGVRLNDVWGWTDPSSGREYAIVGHMEGTEFLDISDPNNPVHLGTLERTADSPANTWRDIKTYRNHAYIVADGAGEHGVQIFDLTQLRSVENPPAAFSETAHYDGVASAHNIVINEETGFAYIVGSGSGGETCGGGLHMIDIRNPENPVFVGCFADPTTGGASTGYSHDAQCVTYSGPDVTYSEREICFSANETAISIADVTDKSDPKPISTGTYPDKAYVHQGWLSEDQAYFFQNDEGDETSGKVDRTRTLVWDVRDLDDPVLVREYFATDSATDHNLYVKGNYLFSTNNAAGLRILDVSDPVNPVEVGHFDTTPFGENSPGFDGTWSSYPYFQSGVIVVTSRREGVFFLKKKETDI